MKILALTSWWPEPDDNGIKLRLNRLIRSLSRNHEVHLLSLCSELPDATQVAAALGYCVTAEAMRLPARSPGRASRLSGLLSPRPASVSAAWSESFAALVRRKAIVLRPQLVIAFELATAPYALGVPETSRILEDLELAALYDNVITATGPRRIRRWLTWIKHCAYVRQILLRFNAYTTVSAREQRLASALAHVHLPTIVIPNGADVNYAPYDLSPEPDHLIYPGALSYQANFDAMSYFLGNIFPTILSQRPTARLRITGRATSEQIAALPVCAQVEFTGFVPDIKMLVAQSWAEVVPLRKGSGTRLKILEALALGTPVISTSKGMEGLDLEPGLHLLVADTPQRFAECTLDLLARVELRESLRIAGQRVVAERYDWQLIGSRFNDFIDKIVRGSAYAHPAA